MAWITLQVLQATEREIARFELADFVDELTETYSHGMKQRTVFASALLHAPRVLVVDEPMIGLDPHSIRLVKDLDAAGSGRGMCVFMSTHTLQAAEEIANRVGIMSHGSCCSMGRSIRSASDSRRGHQSLESMYLALTETNGSSPKVGA